MALVSRKISATEFGVAPGLGVVTPMIDETAEQGYNLLVKIRLTETAIITRPESRPAPT